MRLFGWRQHKDEELDAEIRSHLDEAIRDRIARGESPDEARANARREFGNVSLVKETTRAMWGWVTLERLWQDLRFGMRMLSKQPRFTLIATITLALGIGATTAIFSMVHAVLLNPLPFAAQEQLVALWKQDTTASQPFVELSYAEVRDWGHQTNTLSSVATLPATVYGYGYVLTGRGEAVQLESAKVSGNFFATLGVQAAQGRLLNDSDDQLHGAKVAIISDRLWRERFNADANVIGQSVTLSEDNFTIIGVLPAKFEFPKGVDLWLPFKTVVPSQQSERYGATFLTAVGRLKPGVTLAQAEAELNTIVARIAAAHPETDANGHRIVITPLATHLFGDVRQALWMLLAATGMLLLIATANIANLSLARATARRREFAVRSALGAGRLRMMRQLLTESVLLALAGGSGGVLLSQWLIKLLALVAPADIPRIEDVSLNSAVLFFSLAITLLTALLCGLVPALSASRLNLNQALNEGGNRMSGERSGGRTRNLLVIAEVAITVVLLIGATLILRSLVNLSRLDLGFDTANVLTMQLRLQGSKYGEPQARRAFYKQLIERLESRPGIESASAVLIRPMEGHVGWDVPFALEGQSDDESKKNRIPNFEAITPHYFRTIKLPLKAGRGFTDFDTEQSQPVVIISETMAKTMFGAGVDPIGKRLRLGLRGENLRTIIGVAADTRYRALQDVRFDMYIPFTQWAAGFVNHFAVRTTVDPKAILPIVRQEVAALDATQAVSRVATMDEMVATHLAQPRFSAMLLNWLSGLALLLAGVGIYGVLAYSVAQRTGEFGIRIALGARGIDILKLVIRQGLHLVAIGLLLGLTLAFALTRFLEKLLFGVNAADPMTFALAVLLITGIALPACWFPARRATKADPLTAIHHE